MPLHDYLQKTDHRRSYMARGFSRLCVILISSPFSSRRFSHRLMFGKDVRMLTLRRRPEAGGALLQPVQPVLDEAARAGEIPISYSHR